MSALFQLGVLLLFLGAVPCKERSFSNNGLGIKTYEYDLQRGNEPMFTCDICKKILNKIFRLIGKELSKDNIDTALNKVCEKELKFMKNYCLKFIRKYKAKLTRAIMSAANAPDACKHLGLCKKSQI